MCFPVYFLHDPEKQQRVAKLRFRLKHEKNRFKDLSQKSKSCFERHEQKSRLFIARGKIRNAELQLLERRVWFHKRVVYEEMYISLEKSHNTLTEITFLSFFFTESQVDDELARAEKLIYEALDLSVMSDDEFTLGKKVDPVEEELRTVINTFVQNNQGCLDAMYESDSSIEIDNFYNGGGRNAVESSEPLI